MDKFYTNLPVSSMNIDDSTNNTIKFFNQYYTTPLQIDNNSVLAIQAFFEKRGFSVDSAESIALIIVSQATKDGVPPSRILDTLGGLDSVTLSGLLTEILNYNRFKSSSLGIYISPIASDEVQRNIIA